MPYALTTHVHEREVSRHVAPVYLMPHVAPFFRGILMTVSLPLAEPVPREALHALYARFYEGEPLVRVTDTTAASPLVRDAVNRPWATVGGFAVDPVHGHAVVVTTLDNLLKGAASQALQNLNLAFGFPERMGIDPWET
jgi:N-acetyl-gamma-glutamyl-phosphate reductase